MRSIWIFILIGGVVIFSISSCATVSKEPIASGELRLLGLHVPQREDIKVNFPFAVNINFEADGKPEIRPACFSFSGDGPYCVKVTDVNYGSPGAIKVQVHAKKLWFVFLGKLCLLYSGWKSSTNECGRFPNPCYSVANSGSGSGLQTFSE